MSSDPADTPPDGGSLYQAALRHLARYAATEAGLRQVLQRRVDRWARRQPDPDLTGPVLDAARSAIDDIVRRLAQAGAVSDAVFAESRAKSLTRGGRSNRSIQMRLMAKGVAPEMARRAAATDADTELAAALIMARKRRIGPYRVGDDGDAGTRLKAIALLARAGFSREIAERVLQTSQEDAEARIFELRR